MEMADHELNGLVDLQLGVQPLVLVSSSPILHGILQLDPPRSHQFHRCFRSRPGFHKLHLDSPFSWFWPSTSRHHHHADHYGFMHLACQSDNVQLLPWLRHPLRYRFVAGRDPRTCHCCRYYLPPRAGLLDGLVSMGVLERTHGNGHPLSDVATKTDSKHIGRSHRGWNHGARTRLAELLVAFHSHLRIHQYLDTVLPA